MKFVAVARTECTAPQERVYNPGYWAIHEPKLRKEMERLGKKIGVGGAIWEDPGWKLPPVPDEEVESVDTDSDMSAMAWGDEKAADSDICALCGADSDPFDEDKPVAQCDNKNFKRAE